VKKVAALIASLVLALLAAGCGSSGSPADYPKDFKVEAGDGAVIITWTEEPDVVYWLFWGRGPNITTTNWTTSFGTAVPEVKSPRVIPGLNNGETYSFTINGRKDGGPGGEGAPTQAVVPQIAGSNWRVGEPMGTGRLGGVAGGLNATTYITMALGENGVIYSRARSGETTNPTNPTAPAQLNGIAYGTAGWVAVGANGTAVAALDGITWESKPTGITANLHGISTSSLGGYIATGAGGTILLGSIAAVWTPVAATGTTSDLYAATYGGGLYVAVGAAGTIVTSPDAVTWTVRPSGTTNDLRGVAFVALLTTVDGVATTTFHYVAVGKAGTVLHSSDGIAWTVLAPVVGGNDLNAVIHGGQFMAVGSAGGIYTSPDGLLWTPRPVATTADLTSVTRTQLGYTAVGTGGTVVSTF
jgi:hypothetical protein